MYGATSPHTSGAVAELPRGRPTECNIHTHNTHIKRTREARSSPSRKSDDPPLQSVSIHRRQAGARGAQPPPLHHQLQRLLLLPSSYLRPLTPSLSKSRSLIMPRIVTPFTSVFSWIPRPPCRHVHLSTCPNVRHCPSQSCGGNIHRPLGIQSDGHSATFFPLQRLHSFTTCWATLAPPPACTDSPGRYVRWERARTLLRSLAWCAAACDDGAGAGGYVADADAGAGAGAGAHVWSTTPGGAMRLPSCCYVPVFANMQQ